MVRPRSGRWPTGGARLLAVLGALVLVQLVVGFGALAGGVGRSDRRDLATVYVTERQVSVADDEWADGQAIAEPTPVQPGNAVRTGGTGRAELEYIDGSYTRLGPDTRFLIQAAATRSGPRLLTRLDVGSSWHRVQRLTGSGAFEVETPVATAAVRGTALAIVCIPTGPARPPAASVICTFTVVDGVVDIRLPGGEVITLTAGQRLVVGPDGIASAVQSLSPEELRADEWIAENLDRDEGGEPGPAGTGDEPAAPAPDPVAPRIAYVDAGQIWVLESDGARTQITDGTDAPPDENSHPRWSPDGTRLAWLQFDGARTCNLVVAAADGSGVRALVEGHMCASPPAWSPDGASIAGSDCSIDTAEQPQLFVVAAGGGEPRTLATPRGAYGPSFSPDGLRLVFEDRPEVGSLGPQVDERDHWDLAVINVDGSGYRRLGLTDGTRRPEPGSPAWSPGGDEIAYRFEATSSTCAQHVGILTLATLAAREVNVPADASTCGVTVPRWNGDGSMLVFGYFDRSASAEEERLAVVGREPGAAARFLFPLTGSGVGVGAASDPDWVGVAVPGG